MPYDTILNNESHDLFINGRLVAKDDEYDVIFKYINHDFFKIIHCPFCGSVLVWAFQEDESSGENGDPESEYAHVAECQKCGYWQGYWSRPHEIEYLETVWEAHISKLAEFTEGIPESCHKELAQYLVANPASWSHINPTRLEKLVTDIFRRNYAAAEVMHVGKPNDGGVDVVLVDSGNKRWLIQVKRRESPNASEGVTTLRNLLGVLMLEQSKYGMVVSTADHFTYWAHNAREKASSRGYTIELIDRGKLQRLIEPLTPSRQWEELIVNKKPDWMPILSKKMPDRRQINIEDFIQRSRYAY